MGLARHIWEVVQTLPRGELLSFGCPDAIFEVPGVPVSEYADDIRALHGFRGNPPDTQALFKANGWNITAIDVHPSRGFERGWDLNLPLPEDFIGKFDAVLDLGTGEHCFNIGQVFLSAHAALKVGGAVLHEHPLIMGNHGFWSAHPTAMLDFYGQNGCDVEAWICSNGNLTKADTKRFGVVADKSTTVGRAVKKMDIKARWPVQARYLWA